VLAQNVGIGTNAPQRKLHVHGEASHYTAIQLSNDATGAAETNGMQIGLFSQAGSPSSQFGIVNVMQNAPLRFATNNMIHGAINALGNVSIGLVDANHARLQVHGKRGNTIFLTRTDFSSSGLSINSIATDVTSLDFNNRNDGLLNVRLAAGYVSQFTHNATTGDFRLRYSSTTDEGGTAVGFLTAYRLQGGTNNHDFYGNVGVNVEAHPDSGRVIVRHNSTTAKPTLRLHEWETLDYARLEFTNTSSSRKWQIAGRTAATQAEDRLNFWHSAAGDILSLTGDGRVGIKTITPATGYALSVRGRIMCEELRVQLFNAWPDYVFADNYKLPSLLHVEQYIKAHKHLPGIPSAAEVEKEGIQIGDMQKRMMEKIEELTLYIIQQQKEIDSLKKLLQ
jgi:hypothetical protein